MNRDDEIFAEALELPVAEHAAFLDRVCAHDPAMRARVAALLAGHFAATDFLAHSPVERPPASRIEEKPGDVIGRYTLVRKIGDGGCGVVYLAEQHEPVRRQVALKVIKLGMDTREVIARFEAERQALAMMNHPDIARVFDAGATDAGRPYFVMEFVDGIPITKYCDEHRLTMTARLELFARVCLALQHAHQKGIVHRDVKPSNILVATHDGIAAPKVIDFGIAKATQGRLTEQTLFTGFDQLIGTPAYMSPEQAELRDLDIDTRSDVYALGVLLYELLSGRPPYDPKSLIRAGVEEIRRIIREVDPPRPSTRLATLAEADRAAVALLRSAAPTQHSSALRGDLDWIVMHCLEKDRDRRYSTAHELADDVRRHLRQEPVVARPPSVLYRTGKFVARNRLACASAAALATALVVGTVVSVNQAIRATRAEHQARTERDTALAATRAEHLARTDAQRRQDQAEDLLTFMLGDFRTELQKIGRLNLLDAVGEKALAYFASLDPRDLTDIALTRQAKALTQIGETRMDQAKYTEAATAFATAYQRAAALTARHPKNGDMLFERAQAEYWIGFVARRRGELSAEYEWLTRYRDSTLALVALEGNKPRAQLELTAGYHNLAVLDLERGDHSAAQDGFLKEKAAEESLLTQTPGDTQIMIQLADVCSWLGSVAERDGRYPDALTHFTDKSTRMETLLTQDPNNRTWQFYLSESLIVIGGIHTLLGHQAQSTTCYNRARTILDPLVQHDPANREWQYTVLTAQLLQAEQLLFSGSFASDREALNTIREKLTALVAAEPSSVIFTRLLASVWRLEARSRMATHESDANEPLAQALALNERLIATPGADNRILWEFTQAHLLAGRLTATQDQPEMAQRQWARVLEVLGPYCTHTNDWRILDPAAQALVLSGKTAEARPLIERLHYFGYHANDPLAASILETVSLPATPTQK